MAPGNLWILTAAAAALTIGNIGYDPKLTGEGFPFPQEYTVVAAAETESNQTQVQSGEKADESAKMGKESGTHTGDEAVTPDNDTKKVDQ